MAYSLCQSSFLLYNFYNIKNLSEPYRLKLSEFRILKNIVLSMNMSFPADKKSSFYFFKFQIEQKPNVCIQFAIPVYIDFSFPMIKVLLTMPRVLFPCILLTIFPVNLSVDRGQSSKYLLFHPQASNSFAQANTRMALSGSSSTAGIPIRVLQMLLNRKKYRFKTWINPLVSANQMIYIIKR